MDPLVPILFITLFSLAFIGAITSPTSNDMANDWSDFQVFIEDKNLKITLIEKGQVELSTWPFLLPII